MDNMNKLRNELIKYIYDYNLSKDDLTDRSFEEILNYYLGTLGINKLVFEGFLETISNNAEKNQIYESMFNQGLFKPNVLISKIIDYINYYEVFCQKEIEFWEGQVAADEANKKDFSIPLRQFDAMGDLAYSKYTLESLKIYWRLCQSTLTLTTSILENLQNETFGTR